MHSSYLLEYPMTTAQTIREPAKRKPRVLVIDDDREAVEVLAELLSLRGYAVDVAFDVADGLLCYEAKGHEVVVSDLSFDNASGTEVARKLSGSAHKPLLIAMTGHVGADAARRSLEAGFDYYVAKPIDWEPFERLLLTRERN